MKNKKISKLCYFLLHKEHLIIQNRTLFRFQMELAEFASTVEGCNFYRKKSKGIRPFINQQLKTNDSYNSKSIRNHLKTYLLIVESRIRSINKNLKEDEIEQFLLEFQDHFSKDDISLSKENLLLFNEITVELIDSLRIVAVAHGGSLTGKEFMKFFENLKNNNS